MRLDVSELVFDAVNEAKLADHGIDIVEVLEALDREPRFFANRAERRASHVMVGPTTAGRLLVVPIEDWGRGIWRPVTAFDANAWQARRYGSSR
jgi:uncharacterized DUF497 family protein